MDRVRRKKNRQRPGAAARRQQRQSQQSTQPIQKDGQQSQKQRRHEPQSRHELEADEIARLERRIREESPAPGSYGSARRFNELPLSQYTCSALRTSRFVEMTEIQASAIPHALAGRDVLGAARTGSGKTLAFIVPALELLYRLKFEPGSGLGALIITPTRELAVQIFDVLRAAGKRHSFSAGLVLGGKDVAEEQARIPLMNIVVCTPGRLLQHCEQTAGFDVSTCELLVLDEADRCLDMGFQPQLDAILGYLPPPRQRKRVEQGEAGDIVPRGGQGRQTLLFSATQTKSVRHLARLSLVDPEYVAVHEKEEFATPGGLEQRYVVSPLEQKLDILWSFLRSHLKGKIVVFFSTCRLVRFVHAAFCKLRPGLPLMALHGGIKQLRRTAIFFDYSQRPAAALFATDIAARGLDFPAVDWVVQFDCPEDEAMYIHRVGRTARFRSKGNALLMLTPKEEEGMVPRLERARIPLTKARVDPRKLTAVSSNASSADAGKGKNAGAQNVTNGQGLSLKLAGLCAQHAEIKLAAQKALKSYVRSVMLTPDKKCFDAHSIDTNAYATSLGLLKCPRLRFLEAQQPSAAADKSQRRGPGAAAAPEGDSAAVDAQRQLLRAAKNQSHALRQVKAEIALEKRAKRAKGRLAERDPVKQRESDQDSDDERSSKADDDEDDFMTVKRRWAADDGTQDGNKQEDEEEEEEEEEEEAEVLAGLHRKRKRLKIDAHAQSSTKIVFDDEGRASQPFAALADGAPDMVPKTADELESAMAARATAVAERLRKTDAEDRSAQRERLRAKRLKRKMKAKSERSGSLDDMGDGGAVAVLGGASDRDSESDSFGGSGSGSGSGSDSSSSSDDDIDNAGSPSASEARTNAASQQDQEELALKMLRARRR